MVDLAASTKAAYELLICTTATPTTHTPRLTVIVERFVERLTLGLTPLFTGRFFRFASVSFIRPLLKRLNKQKKTTIFAEGKILCKAHVLRNLRYHDGILSGFR
jgi:hypothetical protein